MAHTRAGFVATPLLLSSIATIMPTSRHPQHTMSSPTQGDSAATQPPLSSIAIIQAVSLPPTMRVAFAATLPPQPLLETVTIQVPLSPPDPHHSAVTMPNLITTNIIIITIIPTRAVSVVARLLLLHFPTATTMGKSLLPVPLHQEKYRSPLRGAVPPLLRGGLVPPRRTAGPHSHGPDD